MRKLHTHINKYKINLPKYIYKHKLTHTYICIYVCMKFLEENKYPCLHAVRQPKLQTKDFKMSLE